MNIATLSTKGQIVLPAWLREEFHLSKGDKVIVEKKGDKIILKPIRSLVHLRGIDNLDDASEELEKIREEWDEEFEN